MGVDAKWGRVPICPDMSRFVPVCPLLSFLGPGTGTNRDKRGQKRTKGDKTGHFGTNWETPPFSIYPHLALLKTTFPKCSPKFAPKFGPKFLVLSWQVEESSPNISLDFCPSAIFSNKIHLEISQRTSAGMATLTKSPKIKIGQKWVKISFGLPENRPK